MEVNRVYITELANKDEKIEKKRIQDEQTALRYQNIKSSFLGAD